MTKTLSGKGLGTLYGIGVGPGSPELLTLKAIRILGEVDCVLAAASPKNDHSLALSIALPHLPENTPIERLDFPMTRDEAALKAAWHKNSQRVIELLHQGKNLAFLTLGDPLIYSTFGYLMNTLEQLEPGLPIEVVPGITSFQAAAAASRTVVCEGKENMLIVSGINKEEDLDRVLSIADSAVIFKAYRNAPAIYASLAKNGRNGQTVFAARVGLEGEMVVKGLENAPERPSYLSLLLAPPKR